MYGIINQAIQDLVVTNYGEAAWNAIVSRSGIQEKFFLSLEAYDDDVTYKLAQAAADELGVDISFVLTNFGEWWILKTGKEKYGGLMEAGGANLRDFLLNLPNFHNRIMLMYPKLTPPEFQVKLLEDGSIDVHYHSARPGLHDFVFGLLIGLSKLYETDVEINLVQARPAGDTHEVYNVRIMQHEA